MDFIPKTDKQIEDELLIPHKTKCLFEVREAKHHTSQEGKHSIKLSLNVFHEDTERKIDVYITPNFARLFKHAICHIISQEDYEAGHIEPEMFENKTGGVLIGVKDNTWNGVTIKKNTVLDFISAAEVSVAERSAPHGAADTEAKGEGATQEDLPF